MAVLKTRYRDVPWEEIDESHQNPTSEDVALDWNSYMRGRPIVIELIPVEFRWTAECPGPVFKIVDGSAIAGFRDGSGVCTHLAEIGD
jgi:hypothetical protein